MAVEIEVPEELAATIRREVHGHRGRIKRQRIVDGLSEIKAIVPLSELLDSDSTSLAQFPMDFEGYEAVSDYGSSADGGTGVTANKPNHPRPRIRSEAAPIEREDD
jgi:translation elongation factor EF-G